MTPQLSFSLKPLILPGSARPPFPPPLDGRTLSPFACFAATATRRRHYVALRLQRSRLRRGCGVRSLWSGLRAQRFCGECSSPHPAGLFDSRLANSKTHFSRPSGRYCFGGEFTPVWRTRGWCAVPQALHICYRARRQRCMLRIVSPDGLATRRSEGLQ